MQPLHEGFFFARCAYKSVFIQCPLNYRQHFGLRSCAAEMTSLSFPRTRRESCIDSLFKGNAKTLVAVLMQFDLFAQCSTSTQYKNLPVPEGFSGCGLVAQLSSKAQHHSACVVDGLLARHRDDTDSMERYVCACVCVRAYAFTFMNKYFTHMGTNKAFFFAHACTKFLQFLLSDFQKAS